MVAVEDWNAVVREEEVKGKEESLYWGKGMK